MVTSEDVVIGLQWIHSRKIKNHRVWMQSSPCITWAWLHCFLRISELQTSWLSDWRLAFGGKQYCVVDQTRWRTPGWNVTFCLHQLKVNVIGGDHVSFISMKSRVSGVWGMAAREKSYLSSGSEKESRSPYRYIPVNKNIYFYYLTSLGFMSNIYGLAFNKSMR